MLGGSAGYSVPARDLDPARERREDDIGWSSGAALRVEVTLLEALCCWVLVSMKREVEHMKNALHGR